jgi:aminoglycoside phosphotransferase family enzyme
VIETVISKLFIRGNEVYKAYKHRVGDFADLTDTDVRRRYIAEDFMWNQNMAPDIYLELRHVAHDGKQYVHVDPHGAEDWYIVMKKIDTTRNLLNVLETDTPKQHELEQYVETLLARFSRLTEQYTPALEAFFLRGADHIKSEVLGVCDWARTATPELSSADVTRAEQLMLRALEGHPYWNSLIKTLSVIVDTTAENIVFLSEGVTFIDVMLPKDSWRVQDSYFALCRTSADISALVGSVYAEPLHIAYGRVHELPPAVVRVVYELSAALIQVPYRKEIGRGDLAKKYADFVRRRCDDLELLLTKSSLET